MDPEELPEREFWMDEPASVRRLLLVALQAFAELGFYGTTTRDIAKRAQMSATAIYSHYESKAELLYVLINAAHEYIRDRMLATFAQSATPSQRLSNLVAVHVETQARVRTVSRVANYELHGLTSQRRAQIVQMRREMHAVMREAIRLGIESGDFYVTDLEATTVAILSMGIDASRWYRSGGRLSPEQLGTLYASLVIAMLRRDAWQP